MEIKEWFFLITNFVIVAALLRTFFFLWLARRSMKRLFFIGYSAPLIIGITGLLLQSNQPQLLSARFPEIWLLLLLLSYVLYKEAKNIAAATQSIDHILSMPVNKIKMKVIDDMEADDDVVTSVSYDDMYNQLENYVVHAVGTGKAVMKLPVYPVDDHHMSMIAYMVYKSVFGLQCHKDADEVIRVIKGRVREIYTGKVYSAGGIIKLPAGTPHGLEALEYSEVIGDLKKL